ncbi:MAG: tail fiber domain-containing protein [Chitinophagales bacterium]|nr:tail fiber domain-containing protein [Chitinophagales bacterium]
MLVHKKWAIAAGLLLLGIHYDAHAQSNPACGPEYLDIDGKLDVNCLQLLPSGATGTTAGWVLTTDADGNGTWQALPTPGNSPNLQDGTCDGQTLVWDGAANGGLGQWVWANNIYNAANGASAGNVGIGYTSCPPTLTERLDVNGTFISSQSPGSGNYQLLNSADFFGHLGLGTIAPNVPGSGTGFVNGNNYYATGTFNVGSIFPILGDGAYNLQLNSASNIVNLQGTGINGSGSVSFDLNNGLGAIQSLNTTTIENVVTDGSLDLSTHLNQGVGFQVNGIDNNVGTQVFGINNQTGVANNNDGNLLTFRDNGQMGLGTTGTTAQNTLDATALLHVVGKTRTDDLQVLPGGNAGTVNIGDVLTAVDADGNAVWAPATTSPAPPLPNGTRHGNTMWWDAAATTPVWRPDDYNIFNDGNHIGLGGVTAVGANTASVSTTYNRIGGTLPWNAPVVIQKNHRDYISNGNQDDVSTILTLHNNVSSTPGYGYVNIHVNGRGNMQFGLTHNNYHSGSAFGFLTNPNMDLPTFSVLDYGALVLQTDYNNFSSTFSFGLDYHTTPSNFNHLRTKLGNSWAGGTCANGATYLSSKFFLRDDEKMDDDPAYTDISHIFIGIDNKIGLNLTQLEAYKNRGICGTDPKATVHIGGQGADCTEEIFRATNTNAVDLFRINNAGQVFIDVDQTSSCNGAALDVDGDIDASGTVFANGSALTSDHRYKQNIAVIENPIDIIRKMSGVYYTYKIDEFKEMNFDNRKHIGFIAQDLEKILPEAVLTKDDGYKAVEYANLTALLAEGIKAQQNTIEENYEALTQQLKEKEEQIQALTNKLNKIEQMLSQGTNTNTNTSTATNTQVVAIKGNDAPATSYLQQNVPNPFENSTYIEYAVSELGSDAQVVINDLTGKIIKTIPVSFGKGKIDLHFSEFASQELVYSLYINGKLVDSKRMIKQ